MDNSVIERIENNFINIYNKFDILEEKLNDYHVKFDKIIDVFGIIISDEYTKIYKTYYPMKNFDLVQDRFFIHNAVIDVPLKTNTYIIFEYSFNSECLVIPLVINLKIDNIIQKNFSIHLKKHNKIRHMLKLDYNVTKINFYLYLLSNEKYNDDKWNIRKILYLIIRKLNLTYFLYEYMAYYYRKPIKRTVDDVKLKVQVGALTLKLSENINEINDLIEVDKNIKEDIVDNSNLINSNNENISKNNNEIYKKGLLITSNKSSIYAHKKRLDVIEEDIKNIPSNSTEIINIKTDVTNLKNIVENDIITINSNIKNIPNMKTSLDNVKYRQ